MYTLAPVKSSSTGTNPGNDQNLAQRVEYLEKLLLTSTKSNTCINEKDLAVDHDEQDSASPQDLDFDQEDSDLEPPGQDSLSENELRSTESCPSSKAAFIGSLSSIEENGEERGVQYQFNQTQWNTVLADSLRQHQQPNSLLLDKSPSLDLGVSFPFSSEPTSSLDSLLAGLPPRRHRDYLVGQYFACFSPLLHVIHDPTFMAEYVSFNRNPRSVKLSWLALLFTLLALAVTTLDEHDPLLQDLCLEAEGGDGMKLLAKKYRTGAMNALAADSFLVRHNLTTLQVLVLLIYAINHSEGAAQSMALLGLPPTLYLR